MVSLDQGGEQCSGGGGGGGGATKQEPQPPRAAGGGQPSPCDHDSASGRAELPPDSEPAVAAEAAGADSEPDPASSEYDDFATPAGGGRGRVVRGRGWRGADGQYVRYKCFDDNIEYLPGDSVYIESNQKDQPYFICTIQDFRRSKRDTLMVNIKWFYRVCELPENVYQLLVQDRTTEHDPGLAVHHPAVKHRELFISDATDAFPVAVLRGPCKVIHYSDVHKVREYVPEPDTFFYVLTYNPETRRLASTQGEIRVGPSHQAKLPEYRGGAHAGAPGRPTGVDEQRLWVPGRTADSDLMMFVRAARSMAEFAGICDGSSTNNEFRKPAERDDTTQNALDVLHHSGYEQGVALQALVKSPVPVGVHQRWSEEETKKFVKGLRQYGKNFFRIRKELIPHKETSELVEFYYLWKKTPGAQGNRPRNVARHRRNGIRRIKSRKGANKTTKDEPAAVGCDLSSASEVENDESEDSDSNLRDMSRYHCRHCFTTTSKDWHHAGKDHQLLCTNCRLYFKKYGQLPDLKDGQTTPREQPMTPQPTAAAAAAACGQEAGRMRTRTRAKEQTRGSRQRRAASGSRATTPSDAGRQSPGAGSTCSASSSSDKSRASGQRPRPAATAKRVGDHLDTPDASAAKKKKTTSYASGDDSMSDSGSDEPGTDAADGDLPSSQASSPSLDDQTDEPPPRIKAEPPQPTTMAKPEPLKREPLPVVSTTQPAETAVERPERPEPKRPEPERTPVEADRRPAPTAEPEPAERAPPQVPATAAATFTESSGEEDVKPNLVRLQHGLAVGAGSPAGPHGVPHGASRSAPHGTPPAPHAPHAGLGYPAVPPPVAVSPLPQDAGDSAEPQNLTVKQEPRSDSDEPHRPPPPLATVKAEPRPPEPPPLSSLAPGLPPHPAMPPLPPMPSLPPHPVPPGYPPHVYGYPYPYPYAGYPSYPPARPPAPADVPETLDLRKADSRESPASSAAASTVSNAVSVVTRTSTAPSLSAPTELSASVTEPRHYPYSYSASVSSYSGGQSSSVHYSSSVSVSTHGPSVLVPLSHAATHLMHPSHPSPHPSAHPSIHRVASPVASAAPSVITQAPVAGAPPHGAPPGAPPTPVRAASPPPSPRPLALTPNQPPSTQALPPTIVPGVGGYHDPSGAGGGGGGGAKPSSDPTDDDDEAGDSPPAARPPSPEPKIEDSECHRSQSAIFLRHWNRGENSSCARTDMTFKPVPESKLARRREERQRRQTERQERERADRDRQQQQQQRKEAAEKQRAAGEKGRGSPRTPSAAAAAASEHDRLPVRPSESGLSRLSDYGRPLPVISPGDAGGVGVPYSVGYALPPHLEHLAAALPPGVYPRDRIELELLERRDRELRELRERDLNERLKEEMFKSRPLDAHWFEMQRYDWGTTRRPGGVGRDRPAPPGHQLLMFAPAGHRQQQTLCWMPDGAGATDWRQMMPGMFLPPPPPGSLYPPPPSPSLLSAMERERLERLGGSSVPLPPSADANERLSLSLSDPMVRLQMAGFGVPVPPEYHTHAHAHAHSHTHAHTHLHLHPGDAAAAAAAAAAAGYPLPPGYPAGARPGSLGPLPPRPSDAALFAAGYPPHLAGRAYEDQLAQLSAHAAAQEHHLHRQILERERLAGGGAGLPPPPHGLPPGALHHPSLLAHQAQQQHEELIRYQRERDKRAMEEAARAPPKP